jgi:hypothetical protein
MIQTALQAFNRGVEGGQRTVQVLHRFAQAVEDVFDLLHRLVGVQRGLGESFDPASLLPAAHGSVCHDGHYDSHGTRGDHRASN